MQKLFGVVMLISCGSVLEVNALPRTHMKPSDNCSTVLDFHADESEGFWRANLSLISVEKLQGVWARLMFQGPVKSLRVDGPFGVIASSRQEFMITNRNILLQQSEPLSIMLEGEYFTERSILPRATRLVLNGRTVCEEKYQNPLYPICGQSQPDVARVLVNKHGVEWQCQGTVISPHHILTSYRCVSHRHLPHINSNISVILHGNPKIWSVQYIRYDDENNFATLRIEDVLPTMPVCISFNETTADIEYELWTSNKTSELDIIACSRSSYRTTICTVSLQDEEKCKPLELGSALMERSGESVRLMGVAIEQNELPETTCEWNFASIDQKLGWFLSHITQI